MVDASKTAADAIAELAGAVDPAVREQADRLTERLRVLYPDDCEVDAAVLDKHPGFARLLGTNDRREYYEEYDQQAEEALALKSAHIPRHHQTAYPAGHPGWMMARDRLIKLIGTGFLRILLGYAGTGKTQMAADVIRAACQQGRSATYRTAMQFFNDLRSAGYRTNAVIGNWMAWTLLVIDEADVKGDRRWEDQTLIDLIDRRYRDDKGTILISNLHEQQFWQMIGEKVRDRAIETGGIVQCGWPSYRKP